jgi:hypothetical protein
MLRLIDRILNGFQANQSRDKRAGMIGALKW